MLTFVLNGLVFLILGIQIPQIVKTIWNNTTINFFQLLCYILLFTITMTAIRFLWFSVVINKNKNIVSSEDKIVKVKDGLIIAMAGVRGSVTLATCLSLPLMFENGILFAQRDIIIFLATGVILMSLLSANFLLPLLLKSTGVMQDEEDENQKYLTIIENVIKQLDKIYLDDNHKEFNTVKFNYILRANQLKNRRSTQTDIKELEKNIRQKVLQWEEENTKDLVEKNKIS